MNADRLSMAMKTTVDLPADVTHFELDTKETLIRPPASKKESKAKPVPAFAHVNPYLSTTSWSNFQLVEANFSCGIDVLLYLDLSCLSFNVLPFCPRIGQFDERLCFFDLSMCN
jgi:hypothetical protein